MRAVHSFYRGSKPPRRGNGASRGKPASLKGNIMTNVQHEIKGDKLILTIDVSAATLSKAEPSKSGKTKVVATTHGFTNLGAGGVSLNVTTR